MLTVAQITDLHVTTEKDPLNQKRNEDRLRQTMKTIHALRPRPVAIIASGDLVDRGEIEEYYELKRLMDESEIPIYYALGNHDGREAFLQVFSGPGAQTDENGYVQYAVDFGPFRMVVMDTLEGPNHGEYDEKRAAWLARTLDEAPDQPTAIILHHPPIPSGIRWMDPDPKSPWIVRLEGVLKGRDQIQVMMCGHIHRAFNGLFAGHMVASAPATSIQLTLDLTEVDMHVPDGREILVEEPPGFQLLMAHEGHLTTHCCLAGDFTPAVTYNFPFRKLA
ncbi:MAG: phosphodiesterase [Phenylobacterium sp.]|uniref:phosphodiesterase n=1 Tax=Phenylobacterium sp. TaxID=1871053 RepID=UPI001A372F6B|nr:phosphodiesterase [Phenylobacterium sp.]MBL8553406.1 phosphodiesterase [Phenylobacterium sp.]